MLPDWEVLQVTRQDGGACGGPVYPDVGIRCVTASDEQ
jgi:hypothetical protein